MAFSVRIRVMRHTNLVLILGFSSFSALAVGPQPAENAGHDLNANEAQAASRTSRTAVLESRNVGAWLGGLQKAGIKKLKNCDLSYSGGQWAITRVSESKAVVFENANDLTLEGADKEVTAGKGYMPTKDDITGTLKGGTDGVELSYDKEGRLLKAVFTMVRTERELPTMDNPNPPETSTKNTIVCD